jgi:hypothetical protein
MSYLDKGKFQQLAAAREPDKTIRHSGATTFADPVSEGVEGDRMCRLTVKKACLA